MTIQVNERAGLPSDMQLHLVNTIEEAWAFKRWASERHEILGFDTETSGLDPRAPGAKLRLVQIGDHKTGWAIPWEQWGGVALEILNEFDGQWIAHNIAFDARWLEIHGGWKLPWHRAHDTMIMAQVVNPLGKGGLKPLAVQHVDRRSAAGDHLLKEAMAKEGWGWEDIPVDYDAYWAYGALDPVLTVHLYDFFRADKKYPRVYELEMAARRVISHMEDNGARIDIDYCDSKYKELSEYVDKSKSWALKELGFSIGSSQQLIKFFRDRLGAEITRTTKSGAPSVDKYQLKMWVNDPPSEAIGQYAEFILKVRQADKLAESYFKNFLNMHVDGVLHPSIKTLGARTGRMSMTNPALQTLPKGEAVVRNAFIPHDGQVLVSSDYSQIEMRLMAHFSEDPHLAEAFHTADRTGGDFFVEMGKNIYNEPGFSKKDKRRALVKNCVPLESEILTKRGWLSYDQVQVGDYTVGYDFTSRKNTWTRINEVYVSDDSTDVYEFGNRRISTRCTYDHRWVTDSGRGSGQRTFSHTYEIPGNETRVILSAPMTDGDAVVTDTEALILGWVLGDGYIKRGEFVGAPSQGKNGHKVACYAGITQSKKHRIEEIDTLLTDVPHKRYDNGKQVCWALNPTWSRDLLFRANIFDKKTFDPWDVAASLTESARQHMLDGLNYADGKSSSRVTIVQAEDTPVAELCVALMYLLGTYASTTVVEPDGQGWQKNTCVNVHQQHARFTGQKAHLNHIGEERVWCVSTDLGSWTMRQDGRTPMLTGNTMYGAAYGGGVATMAEAAGVPFDQMKAVSDQVFRTYPGIKKFQATIEDLGVRRERSEGQGYVTTPYGRRLPCDEGRVYSLTNYLLQGHAAEVLKDAIVRMDMAGLGDYALLPIHDEVIFSVPKEDAEDVMHTIKEVMSVNEGYAVPIPADPEGPLNRWGEKYS